ncbi:hypothetical protein V8C44DRAFT_326731 [Trichoderma aethiopicum]
MKMRRSSPRLFAKLFNPSDKEYRVLPSHKHHGHPSSTKRSPYRRCCLLLSQGALWQLIFLAILTTSLFFSAQVLQPPTTLTFTI